MCRHAGASSRFGRQAYLLACPQEQGWPGAQASRGGAVHPQNPSVHFIFSMIFIASWQLSAISYLFICFSFQLQRKLHKLMALFYSCLNYNLSNCALCTKGFQSQVHGQMDEGMEGYTALAAQATVKTDIFKNQWWDKIALESPQWTYLKVRQGSYCRISHAGRGQYSPEIPQFQEMKVQRVKGVHLLCASGQPHRGPSMVCAEGKWSYLTSDK